jgi:hypothetical protein
LEKFLFLLEDGGGLDFSAVRGFLVADTTGTGGAAGVVAALALVGRGRFLASGLVAKKTETGGGDAGVIALVVVVVVVGRGRFLASGLVFHSLGRVAMVVLGSACSCFFRLPLEDTTFQLLFPVLQGGTCEVRVVGLESVGVVLFAANVVVIVVMVLLRQS